MSGSNNEITNSAGPASSTEPSMEEILASIRRILSDEQTGGQATPDEADEDEEILVLDSSMVVRPGDTEPVETLQAAALEEPEESFELPLEEPPHLTSEPSAPDFPAVENTTLDLPPTESLEEHLTEEALPEERLAEERLPEESVTEFAATGPTKEIFMSDDAQEHVQPPYGIVGDSASDAAVSSIGSLIRSISSERSIAIGRPGLTLEDLVREELRPLLKSWLDSNLPQLVERIVRAEIQRVVERTGI